MIYARQEQPIDLGELELYGYEENPRSGLPPQQFCLLDFKNTKDYFHSLPTPVDNRGLVDVPQLIADIKKCVDPAYEWPADLDVHHFYYPDRWYPHLPEYGETFNPHVFRDISIHKGLVPRQFHNLLHWVVQEPPVPNSEVMHYRVEAWNVAKDLFRMARGTIQWEKRARRRRQLIASNPAIVKADFAGEDIIGEEVMEEVFDKNFRGLSYQLKRQEAIPAEFRLVELEDTPQDIATGLGKLIMPRSISLVRSVAA